MKVISTIVNPVLHFTDTKEYDFPSFLPALMFINGQRNVLERAGMKVVKRGPVTVLVDDVVKVTYTMKRD